MPTFSYRALKSDGKIAEGLLDAGSRPDALRQIETLGLRPVNVAEKNWRGEEKWFGRASIGWEYFLKVRV